MKSYVPVHLTGLQCAHAGHSGDEYNDLADQAANKGRYQPNSDLPRHQKHSTEHSVLSWLLADVPSGITSILQDNANLSEATEKLSQAILAAAKTAFKRDTMQPRTPWITTQTLRLI